MGKETTLPSLTKGLMNRASWQNGSEPRVSERLLYNV
jgi:hypothetical protein